MRFENNGCRGQLFAAVPAAECGEEMSVLRWLWPSDLASWVLEAVIATTVMVLTAAFFCVSVF